MDANGTIRFVLGFPKTICFVRAKGSYFSQRCALYTLNCMELSGSASKEVATHTFQKRVRLHKSVMACSKVCLLCPPALEQMFGDDVCLFQSQWSKINGNKGCYIPSSTCKGQRA